MNDPRQMHDGNHIERVLNSVSEKNSLTNEGDPSPFVNRSWQRCIDDYNITPEIQFSPKVLSHPELRQCQEAFSDINHLAQNSVDTLYSLISDIGYTVLLTDNQGITLDCRYNPECESIYKEQGLYTGTDWSEETAGTNGIGTCIVEKEPVIIRREDHFFPLMLSMTCTVSPIFDSRGQLLASLDATTLHPETPAQNKLISRLVEQYARQIETRSFIQEYKNDWLLYFSQKSELTDTLSTGILAVDDEGKIVACNRNAFSMLAQKPGQSIINEPLESIFDQHFSELIDGASKIIHSGKKLHTFANHHEFFFNLHPPENKPRSYFPSNQSTKPNSQKPRLKSHPDLDTLVGDDIHLQVIRNKIRQTINQDLNILIIGETGTGKEAFAKAIHDASDRKNAPFIAINCAAIPDSLIESELFGYSSGTFTGALKKGMKGKVLQANYGTLFLDEIGDMPLHLQTRLLRVLSEMEVVPLGETQPIPLDIQLISATNKDVMNMIEDHSFRSDLYFRLNGVSLELPSLRNRSDKAMIIKRLFNDYAQKPAINIDDEAMQMLVNYAWPGNIRQLINVAKYSNAMSQTGEINLCDLPNDIRSADIKTQSRNLNFSDHDLLLNSLKENKWNITKVAKQLNICRATVYRKMKSYDIVPPNDL